MNTTNANRAATLPSASADAAAASTAEVDAWTALPTETEIYILPDGCVVVADLPAELAALVEALGKVERGKIGEPT